MIRLSRIVALAALTLLGASAAQADLVAAEPGHAVVLHADSLAPLHPSQGQLGDISTPLESIAVDPDTGRIYLQRIESFGGCPTSSTDIFSLDIGAGGVVAPVALGTGFGICDRGSDLGFDPARGLLLAQHDNFAGGAIKTIDPATGVIDTWVEPSVFFGNTFGMQMSAGIGAIPAGDITYLADLGGGINSAPFGGPNVFRAPFPGGGGDDLYIQPDGDIVFIGDVGEGIWVYDPFTFVPTLQSVPSAIDMFLMAGLNFGCGTKATVCPDTGDGFISWSCAPGGDGIFRVDEALTTATLLVRVELPFDEGVQDMVVGPASDGSGTRSLYVAVTSQAAGMNQVWEITDVCGPAAFINPTCEAGGPYVSTCRDASIDGVIVDDADGGMDEIRYTSSDPNVTVPAGWMPVAPGPVPPVVATLDPAIAPCGVVATITIEVRDAGRPDEISTCETEVIFEDLEPPTVVGSPEPIACLWPPNHRYVCFSVADLNVAATDSCSEPVTIEVVGCASNQPDDAPDPDWDFNGDGSTEDDCLVSADGASICVRAERSGGGETARDGRTYSVLVVATDQCGNASAPVPGGSIYVPHDQSPAETGCLDPTKVGIKDKDLIP